MNKLISICTCIVLCCIIFASCSAGNTVSSPEAFVGMTYDEFCEQIPENQRSQYYQYLFFTDSLGNPCAACFGHTPETYLTIVECYSYSRNQFDTSAKSFAKIKPGMTVFEVVELVGFPVDAPTFGLSTLLFVGDEGEYIVVLDDTNSGITISEISPR